MSRFLHSFYEELVQKRPEIAGCVEYDEKHRILTVRNRDVVIDWHITNDPHNGTMIHMPGKAVRVHLSPYQLGELLTCFIDSEAKWDDGIFILDGRKEIQAPEEEVNDVTIYNYLVRTTNEDYSTYLPANPLLNRLNLVPRRSDLPPLTIEIFEEYFKVNFKWIEKKPVRLYTKPYPFISIMTFMVSVINKESPDRCIVESEKLAVWKQAAKNTNMHLRELNEEGFEFGLLGSPYGWTELKFTDSPRVFIIDDEHKLQIHAAADYDKAIESFLRSLIDYPPLEDKLNNLPYIFRITQYDGLPIKAEVGGAVNELEDILNEKVQGIVNREVNELEDILKY